MSPCPLHALTGCLTLLLLSCVIAGGRSCVDARADQLLTAKQGEILYLTVQVDGEPGAIQGRFRNRRVPFFTTGREGEFGALVGIDMADVPGQSDLKADITYPDAAQTQVFRVAVAPEEFREQRMTLPKDQVDPDAATLKRIAREKKQVATVLAGFTPKRLWALGFVTPVEGSVGGAFGSTRILNGRPRNQHNGEDIAAPLGTLVKATNDGVVRMVDDHFFSGKGVILDHGLGLFTMYFHLDRTVVQEGTSVARGDVIGTVGQSGRATGPHLHWGVWLNGTRVNPFALVRLSLDR